MSDDQAQEAGSSDDPLEPREAKISYRDYVPFWTFLLDTTSVKVCDGVESPLGVFSLCVRSQHQIAFQHTQLLMFYRFRVV